jgi:hypothetical protein
MKIQRSSDFLVAPLTFFKEDSTRRLMNTSPVWNAQYEQSAYKTSLTGMSDQTDSSRPLDYRLGLLSVQRTQREI